MKNHILQIERELQTTKNTLLNHSVLQNEVDFKFDFLLPYSKADSMTTTNLAAIALIILLTSIYYKMREQLNRISNGITSNKLEKNKLEVVMQPKWFLYSTFPILILWILLLYLLFSSVKWWGLLYLPLCLIVTAILSFFIPPRKKSINKYFFKVTHNRYRQRFKYTPEEERLLIIANDYLKKLINF